MIRNTEYPHRADSTDTPRSAGAVSTLGGLQGRHRYRVDHVPGAAAAGQIIRRLRQPLKERTDRRRAGEPLDQLVGDVAGIEIGKDENVRGTPHPRTRELACRDLRNERGIDLDVTVDREFRISLADSPCRF